MRYFVLGRRGLLCACAAIAVISVLLYNFPAARTLVASAVAGRELPIYCVDTDEKKVALTFDAAWGNEDTHALAEIFKEYDVPVTFFVTAYHFPSERDVVFSVISSNSPSFRVCVSPLRSR